MLKPEEIASLIRSDHGTGTRQRAAVGWRYYQGEHDILRYRIFYFDDKGCLQEDKHRSNIKIPHRFFTELVDQETQYLLSGSGPLVRSDIPELQKHLDEYFGQDDFRAELSDTITGAAAKGYEFMYAYKNAQGRTAFQNADALRVTEVEPRFASDGKAHCIYQYDIRETVDGKIITCIEVHDEAEVTYYIRRGEELPELDRNRPRNPCPNVLYRKDNDDSTYFEGLGFLPFFRLDNNRERRSDVYAVKALIDDYDLMACGLSNNLQDMTEGIYVVKGYQGDNLDELQRNIRTKKVVGVDAEGDVEIRTIAIPTEARRIKLELDEKNIYRFGMGFNAAQLGDGGNITNVVIKSRYALLDLKCNKMEQRVKQFLRKLVGVVLEELNTMHGTAYTLQDVYFRFEREIMTNAADNAQIDLTRAQTRSAEVNVLLSLLDAAPEEQLRRDICARMGWDYEAIRHLFPVTPEQDVAQAVHTLLEASP